MKKHLLDISSTILRNINIDANENIFDVQYKYSVKVDNITVDYLGKLEHTLKC